MVTHRPHEKTALGASEGTDDIAEAVEVVPADAVAPLFRKHTGHGCQQLKTPLKNWSHDILVENPH